jgi:hypothetical protein
LTCDFWGDFEEKYFEDATSGKLHCSSNNWRRLCGSRSAILCEGAKAVIGPGENSMVQGARRGLCALALTALGVSTLAAQNGQPARDDNVPTLRVYSNLVQIPTLVLGKNQQAIPPIAESRFFVSIDGGPKFRVTHARREGDDPISLAILLDLSRPTAKLMERIDDAIAELAALSLTARDELGVYALDCQLSRISVQDPTDRAAVRQAVDSVLKSWKARGGVKQNGSCPNPLYFWDSVTIVTKVLRAQSGLRVMLVVSDGFDGGSRYNWNLAREYAQSSSVAIFGLTGEPKAPGENPFDSICELSGGILLTANPHNLAKQLQWFMTMVRGRYIVEFPHPVSTKPSRLVMDMTIAKSDAFIRPAGARVLVDDPKILADPMTILPDSSYAPRVGNRKVMAPH